MDPFDGDDSGNETLDCHVLKTGHNSTVVEASHGHYRHLTKSTVNPKVNEKNDRKAELTNAQAVSLKECKLQAVFLLYFCFAVFIC